MSDVASVAIAFCTISIPSIISAYFSYKSAVTSKRTEQNTNHMKDELVQSVKEAAYEAGLKKGKE